MSADRNLWQELIDRLIVCLDSANSRDLWLQVRQAMLMAVDSIERHKLKSNPRTKELRDIVKGKGKP